MVYKNHACNRICWFFIGSTENIGSHELCPSLVYKIIVLVIKNFLQKSRGSRDDKTIKKVRKQGLTTKL